MAASDENQNPLLIDEKWGNGNGHHVPYPSSQNNTRVMPFRERPCGAHTRDLKVDYVDPDELCGLGVLFGPSKWLQTFATKRTFLFLFCVSWVLQGMYYTYFVSVLTTIERLFQIRSQTAGLIMSATEVGQIGGGLLLSYYGGGGHRPRWIGSGMLLFGFSASLCALPHFLFGETLLKNFLATVPSEENPLKTANICLEPEFRTEEMIITILHNESSMALDSFEDTINSVPIAYSSKVVLVLFFIALLGVGVGQTAVYNLGIPYIDDNVAKEESPTYFGTTIGVRIFGPTLGFVLGSLCTRLSVDPFSKPKFEPTDPRWIGAWWLGHLIISSGLVITSFFMMLFPKKLPSPRRVERNSHRSSDNFSSLASETFGDISPHTEETLSLESSTFLKSDKPASRPTSVEIMFDKSDMSSLKLDHQKSIKDFIRVVYRLVTNQVLVLRTASSVLHLLPLAGLYTFLPKYIETQFRLPVHSAAMISGVGGILVMGLGIFVSGFVIRRLNPSPRKIAGWIAFTAITYSIGMVLLMFLGCSHYDMQGRVEENGVLSFRPVCERSCTTCNDDTFAPICSDEGKTYFSACHAGCKSVNYSNDTQEMQFDDCECLGEDITAKLSLCDAVCPNLMLYVGVFCFFVIIHSTSEVGGMLVTLRCVCPEDKAMALGLISVAIGLFGNVPCPILYGAVIDSSCIHWRSTDDGRGDCQIYNPDTFRTFFHGITAFVMFLAFCVDVCVWHACKGASSMNAEDKDGKESEKNKNGLIVTSSELARNPKDVAKDPLQSQNGFDKNHSIFDTGTMSQSLQMEYDVTKQPLRESSI